jgi:hypothetical protein
MKCRLVNSGPLPQRKLCGVPPRGGHPFEHPRYAPAAQTDADLGCPALPRETVDRSQDAYTAAASYAVGNKIERLFLIRRCQLRRHRSQALLPVEAIHALDVHLAPPWGNTAHRRRYPYRGCCRASVMSC